MIAWRDMHGPHSAPDRGAAIAQRHSTVGGVLAAGAIAATLAISGCGRGGPAVDPAYRAEVEQWRAKRLASLTSETGWLTVVGLFWLQPGENRFGADPGNEVVLRGSGVPPLAGTFELRPDGAVLAHPRAEAGVTLAGQPVPDRPLRSDAEGKPDVLSLGSARFFVIRRGGKAAIRAKDTQNPARTAFKGIDYFPIDPAYRVEAAWETYAKPRDVLIPSTQGPPQKMVVPGVARFELAGKPYALEPYASSPDDPEFMFVFRDATAGHETYGAGRFLDVERPTGEAHKLVLDFNYAYNPPCAFTAYATCPLPERQNELPVRIAAGEKFSGH